MIDLRVVGGCCGTDHEHVAAIAGALDQSRADRGPTSVASPASPSRSTMEVLS